MSVCPLFAAQMAAALDAANGSVTLVLFSDEATPGNVLSGQGSVAFMILEQNHARDKRHARAIWPLHTEAVLDVGA